jgi:prepilin-type N-terminal cleavage/methylation domain-containing protein
MTTFGWIDARGGAERWRAGFTLLEMITVMAVMITLLGVASFAIRQEAPDPSVREPADGLIRLSKTAVRAASTQGRGFAVAFDKQGFSLLGLEAAGKNSRVNLPKDSRVFIKRWGARHFEPAEGQRWWFGSQGLAEPVTIRIAARDSVIDLRFNPLTGSVAEENIEMLDPSGR